MTAEDYLNIKFSRPGERVVDSALLSGFSTFVYNRAKRLVCFPVMMTSGNVPTENEVHANTRSWMEICHVTLWLQSRVRNKTPAYPGRNLTFRDKSLQPSIISE